jgi:hypothetical protein
MLPDFQGGDRIARACPAQHQLFWPERDIDLAVESIRDPAKLPLVAR